MLKIALTGGIGTGKTYLSKHFVEMGIPVFYADEEAKKIIAEQFERAKKLLKEHQEGHNKLAQILLEKEVLFAEDVEAILGKRPWKSRADELLLSQVAQEPALPTETDVNTTDEA